MQVTGGQQAATVTSLARPAACLRWRTPGTGLLAAVPFDPGNPLTPNEIVRVDLAKAGAPQTTEYSAYGAPILGVAAMPAGPIYFSQLKPLDLSRGDVSAVTPGQSFAPQALFTDESGPACMVTDGISLWWANAGTSELRGATVAAGSKPSAVVTGQNGISGVALGGKWIYWSWVGGIRKRPL